MRISVRVSPQNTPRECIPIHKGLYKSTKDVLEVLWVYGEDYGGFQRTYFKSRVYSTKVLKSPDLHSRHVRGTSFKSFGCVERTLAASKELILSPGCTRLKS